MKYNIIATVMIIAFIVGCNSTPKPAAKSDLNDRPDRSIVDPPPKENDLDSLVDPPPKENDLDSFAYRTRGYDMLNVEKSRDWLRENYYTVTDNGDGLIIKRNYVSGNVKDERQSSISKGFKGKLLTFHVQGAMLTTDDDGNIRIGFSRKSEDEQ